MILHIIHPSTKDCNAFNIMLVFNNGSYTRKFLRKTLPRTWFGVSYKISDFQQPSYPYKLIPSRNTSYIAMNTDAIPVFNIQHTIFNSFFPSFVTERSRLASSLCNESCFTMLKKRTLEFVSPTA